MNLSLFSRIDEVSCDNWTLEIWLAASLGKEKLQIEYRREGHRKSIKYLYIYIKS